ncbi:MAG: ATP-binding protein [Nanoarchaeota archaeon]|nr:ATP-binding protein [Nanoarchaeota archaeon]
MLTKNEIKEICDEYDKSNVGIPRKKYLKQIIPFLGRKEILILKGIRRSGKSTILKQLIKHLRDDGIKEENIIYAALDDYRFLNKRSFELLDEILSLVDRSKKSFIFLDEIQVIPNFESWLKTQYDKEINIKFIVSGSSSNILSRELGTLLTGRNITFEIFPLDFKEFTDFGKRSFEEFLIYGGFPEVVLAENKEEKIKLLQNYITNITEKDVIMKRSIRDPVQVENLAHLIMSNPGIRISLNKLSKQIGINIVTLQRYLNYLKDAYMIFEVPFFSYSAKSKFIASNMPKYYVLDNGFYLANTARKETSKQIEAAIAQKFFRESNGLFYWKGKNEVDFVVKNVAYNVVSSKVIPEREFLGLSEISNHFKHIKKFILLCQTSKASKENIEFLEIKYFLGI